MIVIIKLTRAEFVSHHLHRHHQHARMNAHKDKDSALAMATKLAGNMIMIHVPNGARRQLAVTARRAVTDIAFNSSDASRYKSIQKNIQMFINHLAEKIKWV